MNKHVFEMLQAFALGKPWMGFDYIIEIEREDGSGFCWNIRGYKGEAVCKKFHRFDS